MSEQGRLANMMQSFERLSTREKLLVGGLGSGVLLTGVVLAWMVIGGQINELEEKNASVQATLSQIMARKDKFLQEKSRLDADRKRLETNDIKLVKLMEDQAGAQGIQIEDFKEARRFLTENARRQKKKSGDKADAPTGPRIKDLVEESQTVTVHNLSLDQLARFMAAMEARPEPVKVTRLNVQTQQSDRTKLREVRMTVATYRMEEAE